MAGDDRHTVFTTRRETLAAVAGLSVGTLTTGCSSLLSQDDSDRFSIAILPDTQQYARLDNGLFEQQARWIVDNRTEYGIEAVLHTGDVVQNPDRASEWNRATAALGLLDDAGVPTLVALGNHDATTIREPKAFRRRLPTARYAALEVQAESILGYGTYDGSPENAYLRQRIDGSEFLYLTLEFGPRQAVVAWADEVIATHSEARTFVLTHSYLYADDTRVDRSDRHNPRSYGLTDVHNGVELWHALIRRHRNIVGVHSGHHISGNTAMRVDEGVEGNRVAQLFANYQQDERGGMGWLRLLTIDRQARRLSVETFSPHLNTWRATPAESVTLCCLGSEDE